MTYQQVLDSINQNIKQNGNEEITGNILNSVLRILLGYVNDGFITINDVIQILSDSKSVNILGSINPSTITTDLPNGVYHAQTSGTYPNADNIVVKEGYYTLLRKKDGVWSLESETKIPMQDLTQLENQVLTYRTLFDSKNTNEFNRIVKNIYVDSTDNIKEVSYIGLNDNLHRKFLIQLTNSDNKAATFIINSDDLRILRNNIIELVVKEDDIDFREKTRVWIEFTDVEFPTKEEVSFLQGSTPILLLKNSYQKKKENQKTYIFKKDGVNNLGSLSFFEKLVENIYIIDKYNRLNSNNVSLEVTVVNQYEGLRKLIIAFKVNNEFQQFYTKNEIKSGAKKVQLIEKEVTLEGVEVFVDFHDFEKYPTETMVINSLGERIKLTEKSFENIELDNFVKIQKLEEVQPAKLTEINVDKSQGNNAVQLALDTIQDASSSNRYQINVANGLYEIHRKEDFIGNPGYPAMICPKDHVDITGEGKDSTILWADLTDSPSEPIDLYQTIYNWANDCKISNITFVAKNIRYTLHQDNPWEANGVRTYEDCDFIYLGNKGYNRAFGIGSYSGSKTYVNGGKSQSQHHTAFSIHNNINFSSASLWSFKGHTFESLMSEEAMHINNCGSNQACEIYLEGCNFGGSYIVNFREYWLYKENINDHFNHANFTLKGSNNESFYFNNTVVGSTLCIKTISKTKDSKVRFDINTSAYPILIQNHINNYFGNLGNPNRKIKDGYIIQDGANGLSAFAFGGKSILEQYYWPDNNSWTKQKDGLGIRLGDCSINNKSLGIIINETAYNVVFNKDYTNFTNAQVIAEINAVIGSVATAKEYNIGADYYAEMTDVVAVEINNSATTMIPKGTLVTKIGSRIAPCGENDLLYGLLIDDLGSYELDSQGVITSKARVIRNCYVSVDSGNVSSVLHDSVGSRYKISNGRFVADVNGQYRAIDNKYILI